MKKIFYKIHLFVTLAILVSMASCKKDYQVLGGATNDQVFSSAKGIMGVAVGIQRTYSLNVVYGLSDATGLITNETFLLNPGNLSELQFFNGGAAVDNTNALLSNVWSTASKCI